MAFAQPNLGLPWVVGETWKVVRGYHPSIGGNYAIDFVPAGTSSLAVVASADGIAYAMENINLPCDYNWKSPSRTIRINHSYLTPGQGWETTYTHIVDFSVLGITPGGQGVQVKKGQIIGYRGDTGCTTGPHLDYVSLYNGIAQPITSFEGKRLSDGSSPILESGGYNYGDQYLSFNSPAAASTWHPAGTLIRASGDTKVYFLQGGRKRWVYNEAVFASNGFDVNPKTSL